MKREDFLREVTRDGVLRAGSELPRAFASTTPLLHYLVFTQSAASRLDVAAWRTRARSFFAADLGLAVDRSEAEAPPEVDAALLMIHNADLSGTRLFLTRPRDPEDLALAHALEAKSNAAGLGTLAERCPRVWLIAAEGNDDRAALLLAAIVASSELGPILDPQRAQIFGVRTAREKYEALGRHAYR